MNGRNQNIMRKLFGMTAAAALLAGASLVTGVANPSRAFAACTPSATVNCPASTVTISANNTPYQLSGATYSNFNPITLNGTNQTTTSSGANSATVIDASGTGSGWNVTVQATPLSATSPADTIPGPNISTASASSACAGGVTCRGNAAPASSGTIDGGGPAVKVLSAAAGNGMGTFSVTLGALTAGVPASAYAETYSTTITVTLIGGTP
jgi:hypothetical protein